METITKTGQPMESNLPSDKQIAKWLKKWGFPARHIAFLDSMEGKGLKAAQDRSSTITSGNCLFVLCGKRGPGKTQMGTHWGREMARAGKSARYHKAHDLISLIRQQFESDFQRKTEALEGLATAKKAKLLIVDEWSELAGSDFEKRTMTNIIDHRYDNMLSTVIITNHAPKGAIEAVGESIWSRAEETGGVIVCDWPSYRKGGDE